MSSSAEFQRLIFETLKGNVALSAISNGVFDQVPTNPFGSKTAYVSFGPVDTVDDDADCIRGVETTLQIDVWSRAPGFVECKRITDIVKSALHRKSLAMAENALVDIRVPLVRVFRDPDGSTSHGVVQVTAIIEETA